MLIRDLHTFSMHTSSKEVKPVEQDTWSLPVFYHEMSTSMSRHPLPKCSRNKEDSRRAPLDEWSSLSSTVLELRTARPGSHQLVEGALW